MTCAESDYVLREAEKGEFVQELFDQAREHIAGCATCRAPWDNLVAVGESPVIIVPVKER